MKTPRSLAPFICVAALATVALAEPQPAPKTPPATTKTEPAPRSKTEPAPAAPEPSPEEEAMFQFMGSRSGGPNGERTRGVTRGPKQIPIKLVAIAPDSVGVTHLESPRIWWWQSASTSPGEMMFQLETVTQPPVLVFKVKLNALPAGFNVLDPAKLGKDHKFRLNPGVEYSWVLTCFSGVAQNPVKGRVVRKNDLDLASFKATDPKRIAALSESKNWYELFDAVALPARVAPAGNGYVAIRQKLLDQVGLGGEMKAP